MRHGFHGTINMVSCLIHFKGCVIQPDINVVPEISPFLNVEFEITPM